MGTDVIIHKVDKTVEIITRNITRRYNWVSDNIDGDNVDIFDNDYYVIMIIGKLGGKGKIILPKATTNIIKFG